MRMEANQNCAKCKYGFVQFELKPYNERFQCVLNSLIISFVIAFWQKPLLTNNADVEPLEVDENQ